MHCAERAGNAVNFVEIHNNNLTLHFTKQPCAGAGLRATRAMQACSGRAARARRFTWMLLISCHITPTPAWLDSPMRRFTRQRASAASRQARAHVPTLGRRYTLSIIAVCQHVGAHVRKPQFRGTHLAPQKWPAVPCSLLPQRPRTPAPSYPACTTTLPPLPSTLTSSPSPGNLPAPFT